jgi:5-methyltetrahydropteroyltriglutamate--homocysteine methyltransferase
VTVQIDFTEARLATKLDPSLGLLRGFVRINNLLLDRFSAAERSRISVHTCPGGDHDSTHSADADYACLLPDLFGMRAGAFMCELAGEKDPRHALAHMRDRAGPDQKVFVGVIDVLDPRVETPDEVADRICLAAQYIPLDRLGVTDDCGFSPLGDDVSTAREVAFAKIRARIEGIRIAQRRLGIA